MMWLMRNIFLASLLFLMACSKNEFKLDFNLSHEITENYDVTYYATDIKGGLTIQAVASVREGVCMLDGVTKQPSLVYIERRNSVLPLIVYVKKGNDIKISGESDKPFHWIVEGNDINRELTEWRQKNSRLIEINNTDSLNEAIKIYVEENNASPVSLILMTGYYNRGADEKEYNRLMSTLKDEAKDMKWLEIAARADQFRHRYYNPAQVKGLVFRSNLDGADTLRIDEKNPALLAFWATGNNDKKAIVDSLKKLQKEYHDTVRIIADFCLDPDSLAWRNAIKRDSLDKIKRFWVPVGMADSTIRLLKVNGLPYFIVLSKDGNQSYRGKELKEAISHYRNLMKKEK